MTRPHDYQKKQWERRREQLKQLAEHGEYSAEGRPSVEVDGMDQLLFMLRVVHGKPRYDLFR